MTAALLGRTYGSALLPDRRATCRVAMYLQVEEPFHPAARIVTVAMDLGKLMIQ